MDWFRVHPVRLLADVRRHSLTLEEQGFILQLCAHVALFDGALQRDSESLRAEMRPVMARKKFDALWARVSSVALSYVAEVDAQAEECAKKSTSRRGAAHARWSRTDDANADANASTNGNANAHAIADAEEKRREEKRSPQPPKGGESLDTSDVRAFHDAWNDLTTAPLPKSLKLTKPRAAHIRARLKEHPLSFWVDAIKRVERTPFCRGANDRQWCASLDWLTKNDANVVKLLEGVYDRVSRPVEKPLPIVDWANV